MRWNTIPLFLAHVPGSYALDPDLIPVRSGRDFVHTLQKRDDDKCGPGTLSGSTYCPTCDGIDVPTPNMFIKCQDPADKTADEQNNAYQGQHGECRVYHPLWPDVSTDQEQPKCTRYCETQGGVEDGSVAACVGFNLQTGDPHFDENFFYSFRDSEGRYYEMAQCDCNMALPGLVFDIVLEGIAEAMEAIAPILFVACTLFIGVLELAADAAVSALPGGAAVTAAKRAAQTAVRTAKTTYQNGGSEKTFSDLTSAACPQANFGNLNFGNAFNGLVGVSNEYAEGGGCKEKSKRSLEGRAKKGGKGDKGDDERVKCRDLPENSKDQPPKNDQDNGLEGVEEKARKDNDDKNKSKATSQPPKSTSAPPKQTSESPKSTSTTSSEAPAATNAGCAICKSPKPKLARRGDGPSGHGLMYARAPPDKSGDGKKGNNDVCIKEVPPFVDDDFTGDLEELTISDESCAPDSLTARSYDFFPTFGATHLEKRTKRKKGSVRWSSGSRQVFDFGTYQQCSEATGISEIEKYYKIHHDPNFCSAEVEKVDATKATANGEQYQTEHVYEAQTLTRFLKWLKEGKPVLAGSKWVTPTEKWVQEVVVGINTNNPFMLVSEDILGTPKPGDNVFNIMTYGFGRGDGKYFPQSRGWQGLTLAHDAINGPKGALFQGNQPKRKMNTKPKGATPAMVLALDRMTVRRGPAIFEYLRFDDAKGKNQPVWEKWMIVSNWIDLVCHTFDEKYPWGSRSADEPKAPPGEKPSLRALYAFWIDQELKEMETKMEEWATEIKNNFGKRYKNPKGADKQWRDAAFVTPGFAKADKLKFPRVPSPRAGASVYGAYGMIEHTKDKKEKATDIGVPSRIT